MDGPEGFVVVVEPGHRIHFLDWGTADLPGVVAIHGLSQTAWAWAPVARRLTTERHVVTMDLRGHGLSDSPTEGYDLGSQSGDVIAVAEGSGLLAEPGHRVVLAGHGFGAIVATEAAASLGARCAGLVLVDGGWEAMEAATGEDVEGFLRTLDEPPEVLRSLTAFLADRRAFDPGTWDADQERAARSTVVETRAGRVVPTTRPHVVEACVRAMFDYEPVATLADVMCPAIALLAGDDEEGSRTRALAVVNDARSAAGRERVRLLRAGDAGHNLMRYRPDAVAAAILSVTGSVQPTDLDPP